VPPTSNCRIKTTSLFFEFERLRVIVSVHAANNHQMTIDKQTVSSVLHLGALQRKNERTNQNTLQNLYAISVPAIASPFRTFHDPSTCQHTDVQQSTCKSKRCDYGRVVVESPERAVRDAARLLRLLQHLHKHTRPRHQSLFQTHKLTNLLSFGHLCI
jgi:hypothetical protein